VRISRVDSPETAGRPAPQQVAGPVSPETVFKLRAVEQISHGLVARAPTRMGRLSPDACGVAPCACKPIITCRVRTSGPGERAAGVLRPGGRIQTAKEES
jgi:hypothetical protein